MIQISINMLRNCILISQYQTASDFLFPRCENFGCVNVNVPWLLLGMYTRDEIGSPVSISEEFGSGCFRRVISAFQPGVAVL